MKQMNAHGLYTGFTDRNETPIQLGDTLEFDAVEWWSGGKPGPAPQFVIEFDDGELQVLGTTEDLDQYCTIVKKWNEGEVK